MLTFVLYALLAIGLIGGVFLLAVRLLPPGEQIAPAIKDEPLWTLPPDRALATEDVASVRLPVALRGYRFAETDMLLDRLGEELKQRDELIARLTGSAPAAASLDLVADAVVQVGDDDVEAADAELRDSDAPPQETQLPFADVEDEPDEEAAEAEAAAVEADASEPEPVEATTEEPESESAPAMWGAPVIPVDSPAAISWGPPSTVAPPEPTVEPPPRPDFPVASLSLAEAATKRRWWRRAAKPKPELPPVPLGVAPPPNVRPTRPDPIAPAWWRTDEPVAEPVEQTVTQVAESAGVVAGEESVEADMAAMEMDQALDDETPTGVIPIITDDVATADELPVADGDAQDVVAAEVVDGVPWWQIPAVDEPEPKHRRRWGRREQAEAPTVPVDMPIAIQAAAPDNEADDSAAAVPAGDMVLADESVEQVVAAVATDSEAELEPVAEAEVGVEALAEAAEAEVAVEPVAGAETAPEPEAVPEPEPAPEPALASTDVHPTGRRRRRRPQGEPPPAVLTQAETTGWWGRHTETGAEAPAELLADSPAESVAESVAAELEQDGAEPEIVEAEPAVATVPEPEDAAVPEAEIALAPEPATAAANGAPVAPSMYVPPDAATATPDAIAEPAAGTARSPRGRRAGRAAATAYAPPTYVPPAAAGVSPVEELATESASTGGEDRPTRRQARAYVPPTAQSADVGESSEPPAASAPAQRSRGRGRRDLADIPVWQPPGASTPSTAAEVPEPEATGLVDEISEQPVVAQPAVEQTAVEQIAVEQAAPDQASAPPMWTAPPAPSVAAPPPPSMLPAVSAEPTQEKKRRWRRPKDRPTVDVPLFIPPPAPTVEAPPPPQLPAFAADAPIHIEPESAEEQTAKLPIIQAAVDDFVPEPTDELVDAEPNSEAEEPESEPEPIALEEPARYSPPQSVAAWEPPAHWNRQSR